MRRRRKKGARSEESESSGNLNVVMYLNKRRRAWCGTRRWRGFLEFMLTPYLC